jgi:DNA anti-recombination protein RmuC
MTNDDKILKILDVLSMNVATVLEEQHAQRTDIRLIHRDVSELKEDISVMKDEVSALQKGQSNMKKDIAIIKANMATKNDIETAKIELKSEISRNSKAHNRRLTNLEEHVGVGDPTKH